MRDQDRGGEDRRKMLIETMRGHALSGRVIARRLRDGAHIREIRSAEARAEAQAVSVRLRRD